MSGHISFVEIWSYNNLCGGSVHNTDSNTCQLLAKYGHLILDNCSGSLSRNSVAWLTHRPNMTLIVMIGRKTL